MCKRKSNNAEISAETNRKIRGDWGAVNPVTKVIPNKKRNNKPKYRRFEEE